MAREGGAELLVADLDDARSREAMESLREARRSDPVPVLATSEFGHEDAKIVAASLGALGFLQRPARGFDVARKAHELVATRRLVEAAQRQADEVRRTQAELVRSERLATLGWMQLASTGLYGGLGATWAHVAMGLLSAIVDNIPIMYAVLQMNPPMDHGQWLLITLTCGVGGSLLLVGSAAGVALMGASKGQYTFFGHLRWTCAILLGYAAEQATRLDERRRAYDTTYAHFTQQIEGDIARIGQHLN
jgi:hypothetical protein